MKYLLAFAVIAVASALPEPIRLPRPAQPDIAPLMVPQEIMDQVALLVKLVEEAVNDAPDAVYNTADFAVNVLDEAPEAVYAPEALDASAYAVNIVEAVAAAEDVPENTDASDFAVHFVDEAVNADAPAVESDISDYSVKIVETAEINEDAPVQIKTIDIPLPESVVLPLAEPVELPSIDAVKIAESPLETSNAEYAVKFVDVADVDEESPSYMPIKVYGDARLR